MNINYLILFVIILIIIYFYTYQFEFFKSNSGSFKSKDTGTFRNSSRYQPYYNQFNHFPKLNRYYWNNRHDYYYPYIIDYPSYFYVDDDCYNLKNKLNDFVENKYIDKKYADQLIDLVC